MTADTAALYDATHKALSQVMESDGSVRNLNESETRQHVIDPVIHTLGYRTLDHLRLEYRLQASGQFVDYLLLAGEHNVVVEAKALRNELTPKDAGQLVGYCAQEGIRWALLTNGLQWQVFDVDTSGNWEAKRVAEIDLRAAFRADTLADALAPLTHFALHTLRLDDSTLREWAHVERARFHIDRLITDPQSPVVLAATDELAKVGVEIEAEDVVALLRHGTAPAIVRSEDIDVVQPAPRSVANGETSYYLLPAGPRGGHSALDHLRAWLDAGFWGMGTSTPHRRNFNVGDRCCFYARSVGVVAHAIIDQTANQPLTREEHPGGDAWHEGIFKVPLREIQWLSDPIRIDAELRGQLDGFEGRDPTRPWGWFVQSTNHLTEHDFRLVIGEGGST